MAVLHLQIVSLEGVVYDDKEVAHVTLKSSEGEITVYAGHIPLITPLVEGKVTVTKGDKGSESFETSRGVIEVRPDSHVVVLCNTAKKI